MEKYVKARYSGAEVPTNIWLGVSVEDADHTSRIDHLKRINSPARFISFEPLLRSVGEVDLKGIAWAIVGGESGPNPNAPEGVQAAEQPMGVAFWAFLSEAAEQKLEAGGTRLRPDEWKSGDRLRLVDLVAPFATAENKLREAMLGDLATNVFPGRKIKMHSTDVKTGERTVIEIGGEGC